MINQEKVSVGWLQTPKAGDGWRFLVFVKLGIELHLTVSWAVAGEDDPVIAAVYGSNVVKVSRLISYLGDDGRGLGIREVGDLVQLPVTDGGVIKLFGYSFVFKVLEFGHLIFLTGEIAFILKGDLHLLDYFR